MAALVGADRNAVGVFLDGGTHHIGDRAVVAEMHDLDTFALDQAAHHVNGGVVSVEQRSGCHETHGRGGGGVVVRRVIAEILRPGVHVVLPCCSRAGLSTSAVCLLSDSCRN